MQNQPDIFAGLPDEELVIRSQNGETEAFSELIARHYQSSLRLATTILRNRDDAEDEVQNAYAKAFEHIGQFQRGCRFTTWLTRIVVNQCLMRIRQLRRSRTVSIQEPAFEDQVTLELPDPTQRPDRELAQLEVRNVVDIEVRRIPPMLRHAFLLRHVQKLPMEQVAETLGISVAAAKSRLLRARVELQARLEKHQGRLGVATLLAS